MDYCRHDDDDEWMDGDTASPSFTLQQGSLSN